MRSDMKKVLCERPRRGSRYSYHEVRAAIKQTDPDDMPHCQGMRRPYKDQKDFSDLLGPLVRFLRNSVGRRYDDVWSELCANVPGHTTTGAHLRDHARWECETNTFVLDDKVMTRGRRFYFGSPREVDGLYVDPRDGLIYYKEPRSYRAEPLPVMIDGLAYKLGEDGVHYPTTPRYRQPKAPWPLKVIGDQHAMCINGIWYWIDRQPVPPPTQVTYVKDGKVCHRMVDAACRDIITGEFVKSGWYHTDKRQMCSRDLRRHGLRNA